MGARVLVIDDNAVNLDLVLYLLQAFGFEAQGCGDGTSGLAAATTGRFDLVLSDVLMPGLDGYELARRLKSDPRTKAVPLVAVTALAMTHERDRIAQSGFDGYIMKPIDPQRFIDQIRSYLAEPQR